MPDTTAQRLTDLFRKSPVLSMPDLERAVRGRSQRSLFRDLASLGYRSSYTHTGRFYTLASVPDFDADGLWRYQGVGFSRDGTLKATVRRLVDTSEAGRTQQELQVRLGVRVHNPLLDLVQARQLGRAALHHEYVYVAVQRARATIQLDRRRALGAAATATAPPPTLEIEILLDVIHGTRRPPPQAAVVAARLQARGIRADASDVATVLERHGLTGKKTAPSHSRRSRR